MGTEASDHADETMDATVSFEMLNTLVFLLTKARLIHLQQVLCRYYKIIQFLLNVQFYLIL